VGLGVCVIITMILLFCIWFPLLVVLVADPVLRQEINVEGQAYQNQNPKRGGEGEALKGLIEIPLTAGPFLAIVIMDSLLV
jgi:hypothetical protein